MNKYTPELIEEYAKAAEGFNEPTIGRMLRDYATLLRERESANNNDTCTDADCHRCNTPAQHRGDMSHAGELRAKFEAHFSQTPYSWRFRLNKVEDICGWPGAYDNYYVECAWKGWQASHTSRDAEVEALQDALFQISVRLKAERESDMDDMSWHTDMIARAQYLANQCQRIESAPVAIMDTRDALGICAPTEEEFQALYALQGKRMRLVVEDGE